MSSFAGRLRSQAAAAAALVVLSLGVFAAGAGSAPPAIVPLDLGTLGGTTSSAVAVNDTGQVAGNSTTDSGETHAFIWTQAGGMVDLGTLGGTTSRAAALSNTGQVVGSATTESGDTHAFSWTAQGGMADLGTGSAVAVNDQGQVAAQSTTNNQPGHPGSAFVWSEADGRTTLGTLGGQNSIATGISETGQVVGWSYTGPPSSSPLSDPRHPFSWTPASGMVDLGTLGADDAWATALNDAGQVVGLSETSDGAYEAFMWTSEDGLFPLYPLIGATASTADDINESGQLAGASLYSFSGGTTSQQPWIFTQTGGVTWLKDASGYGRAINEAAEVVLGNVLPIAINQVWSKGTGSVALQRSVQLAPVALNEEGTVVGSAKYGDITHAALWATLASPGAPRSVTAVAGDGRAVVSFDPPVSQGSGPISHYTVTATPGGATADGAASPITLPGLDNGTSYTVTVTATNDGGTGWASAPSNAVTPAHQGREGADPPAAVPRPAIPEATGTATTGSRPPKPGH